MGALYKPVGVLTTAPASSSVATARRFVEQHLTGAGFDQDMVATAVLLTSEVVTNAVVHTGSEVEVRVGVGQGARIEVRDASHLTPRRLVHDRESIGGRGLELVETLATGFGVVAIPGDGKLVWFTVGGAATSGDWYGPGPVLAAEVTLVELRHLPLVLYGVMRDHHEALLREYTLDRLNGPGNANHQQLDIAAVERARRRVVAAVAAWSAANGTSGRMHADVSMDIAADDVAGFGAVSQVIAAAEQRSIEGFLLTAPAVPEIVALRSWLFGQILAQLGGAPPVPWTFPDQPLAPTARAPVEVDLSWVQNTDRVVVVADDTNRILAVSNTAADILGWAHDELAGQRLTVIIPPDQREAHVAGFTRQLVTGQGRLLDQEVALSALHRNGHTVPVRVTLTRQLCDDRMVFVALLRPQ